MWPPGDDVEASRSRMVDSHLAARGVDDAAVLAAMRAVPRERFLPEDLAEFAYEDTALPIAEGQTISHPFIVASMAAAAQLRPDSRVLEIGTGSGYDAAVLSRVAGEVWTIERIGNLADQARRRLADLGYDNVHVVHGDGTLGLPERAPFDAIIVAAGAPTVPPALVEQLADCGTLVMPVGPDTRGRQLVRVRRHGKDLVEEDLGAVRFVPPVGNQGSTSSQSSTLFVPRPHHGLSGPAALVHEVAEPFSSIHDAELGPLLERIGDCSVVLIGEASHGTSEFYRMRERITRDLIVQKGFTAVAVEADWPDAARIDSHVRHRPQTGPRFEAFSRFPTWMWRNHEVRAFVDWLHEYNAGVPDLRRQVSFHGLDLYSMFTSRDVVLHYLEGIDPETAAVARERYGCLTPWENDPTVYGRAVVTGRFVGCEDAVVRTLTDLLKRRLDYATDGGDDFVDAAQNALVVANAERYYRSMYYGSRESWNLRDLHMFETLQLVKAHRGADTKVVVWEHNSHVGDASATEMGARGEHNVGMLARTEYRDHAFLVGFGTHEGTVAAASDWGGPLERKQVRPSHPASYERICHDTAIAAFMMHLRSPSRAEIRTELAEPRLERAIGVIYRPETELQSHYFQASLPFQFDEYIWFDRSSAVRPIAAHEVAGTPETYPFGL